MEIGDAQALLVELLDDPAAYARFRRFYGGAADPIDVIRWMLEPDAVDSPLREVPALERVVYARADSAEQRAAQHHATQRLAAITHGVPRDRAALEEAARRYRAAVPAAPLRRAARAPAVLAALIGAVVLALVGAWLAPGSGRSGIEPPENAIALPDDGQPLRAPEGYVLEQWGLGENYGQRFYGFTTSVNEVCVTVESQDGRRVGHCVDGAAFLRDGIAVDRAGWSMHWFADGRVLWGD